MTTELRSHLTRAFQKRVANPVVKLMPTQTLLETTGRNSGKPRRTPIGGRVIGHQFWLVSEFGETSQYVRNVMANPRVRLRMGGKWRTGVAHLLPLDDPYARLRQLPAINSLAVRVLGAHLLTLRIDLDD